MYAAAKAAAAVSHPMQMLHVNHVRDTGENRKPTLEVPKRCNMKSATRMPQAMPTIDAASITKPSVR